MKSQKSWSGDSVSLGFGVVKIDSWGLNCFQTAKRVISSDYSIFYKDWSRTSPDRTGPPELVRSSHWHRPRLRSLVLPPRLDRSDYWEPWSNANTSSTYSTNNSARESGTISASAFKQTSCIKTLSISGYIIFTILASITSISSSAVNSISNKSSTF